MIERFRAGWKRFRSHFWLALLFDSLLIVTVFFIIHSWQTRDLPINEAAPETVLALLDGTGIQSAIQPGQTGVVYFFAPWCVYCRTSIGNLSDLVSKNRVQWGTVIALDYSDAAEVEAFVTRTGINLPVLMGNDQTARDWKVRAFPTYYVIDSDGRITSRSVGYSTLPGMWLRTWWAM